MEEYIPLIILIGLALFLGLLLTNLSALAGPLRPNRIKAAPYESGMDPVGTARDRFSVKFYLVAMFFILFDIELVFMYPWATQYKELGVFGFVEMLTFVIILFVGFIYLLKKGGLKWD
ncbi:MAG: NADH-quinone oxidoreductase subunit A [Bacteroidia bacterium]|nr:NADH-quinone oxidoreductase subunit A [Bacteroidia bacterium]